MTMYVFRNCTVVNGISPEPREGCDVVVEGERIREVSDEPANVHGAWQVDVGGRTIMPGLIDAHAHVALAGHAFLGTRDMPQSLLNAHAAQALRGMLDRGFTTVRDAGGADWGLARAVEENLLAGPRLFICGRALRPSGATRARAARANDSVEPCGCSQYANISTRTADGVDAVMKATREELGGGADHIKVMASGGTASPDDPAGRARYSEDELRTIVREASAAGTYVMAHAYTAEAATRAVSCGARTVEHGNFIDRAAADLMRQNEAYLVPTLATFEALRRHGSAHGLGDTGARRLKELVEAGQASIELAKDLGVHIGFGCDLLGPFQDLQSLEFSLRADVMSAHEIITAATATNAAILQRTGELGVVAPGARADLLVIDGNPLHDLGVFDKAGRKLLAIMKDGAFHKNQLSTTYRDARVVPAGPPIG